MITDTVYNKNILHILYFYSKKLNQIKIAIVIINKFFF